LTHVEAIPYAISDRDQCLYVCRIPRPHLTADRLAIVINDNTDYHLVEIGTVILAVSLLSQGLTASSFEVDGGGVKEDYIEAGEKITAFPEQVFFNDILRASW